MSIPLIQKPDKDDINTSIIAIKRNIERINMLLGLSNSEEIDTSKFATKEELQQAVTDLQPVDEVALNNMQSVTSNAVAEFIGNAVKLYDWNLTDRETIELSDNILNYDIVFICLGLIDYSVYPEIYSLCYPHDILDYILNNNKYIRLTGYDNYYVDYSIISSGSQLWRRASNSTITIYSIYGIGKRS